MAGMGSRERDDECVRSFSPLALCSVNDEAIPTFPPSSPFSSSDIIVLWPTISSSSVLWTLSHRSTSTTTMPHLIGTSNTDSSIDSAGNFKVVAELSSEKGEDRPAVVSFVRPLRMGEGYEGGETYDLAQEVNQVRRRRLPFFLFSLDGGD
jgi:hypothetical protein